MPKKQTETKKPQTKPKKQPRPKVAKAETAKKEPEVVKVEAIEKKPAKKHKEETSQAPKEMIPVIYGGKKDEYHASNFTHLEIVNPTDSKVDPQYGKYVALSRKDGREEIIYYIEPSTFEEYVLAQKYTPANTKEIRDNVLENLAKLKWAWVQFGTSVLAVSKSRLYRVWGFTNFEHYCEQELQLHQSTVHELMASTLFLSHQNPELYKRLIGGQGKEIEKLPSYHSIYLLSKKQKKLEEQELFVELLTQVMDGKISSRDLQAKLREIFGAKETTPTLASIASNYEKWFEALKKTDLSKDILQKAEELRGLLKETK